MLIIKKVENIIKQLTFTKKVFLLFLIHLLIIFFVIPVGQFTDSADYLLGGCLINKGNLIYKDFFSHHFPGTYYFVSLLFKITGNCSILTARLLFYSFFIITSFIFFIITQKILLTLFIVLVYSFFGLYYKTTFPIPESFLVNISLLVFIILFFKQKLSNFWYFCIFFIIQFSLIFFQPIYLPVAILMFFYVILFDKKSFLLGVLSLTPVLIFYFLDLRSVWENVVLFNLTYYFSESGVLSYIQNQTENLLSFFGLVGTNLNKLDRISLLFELILFIFLFLALIYVYKKKVLKINKIIFLILLFLSLSIHFGGFHMLPLTFLLLLFIFFVFEKNKIYLFIFSLTVFAFSLRFFIGPYIFWIKNNNTDPTIYKMVNKVITYTSKNDKILIYPLQPEVYLLTQRFPGSYYYFYLPWVAGKPKSDEAIIKDIYKNKVKLIIFNKNQNISGYNSVLVYSKKIIDSLKMDDYLIKEDSDFLVFIKN